MATITRAQNHVQRMLDIIDESYTEWLTLRMFAAIFNRQAAHLGLLFRRQVGMTVHQRLTRVRLEHAAALIREGMKIEAVAMTVGYRSKKNFYQQFRRQFATTPLVYVRLATCRAVDIQSQEERDHATA